MFLLLSCHKVKHIGWCSLLLAAMNRKKNLSKNILTAKVLIVRITEFGHIWRTTAIRRLTCSSKIFMIENLMYCINFIVSTLRVGPHETCSAFCPQHVSLHTFFQVCRQGFGSSVPYCEGESQAVEALDLPAPTCFRSRSHSYLRAIQAGCSQDEDTASMDSDSLTPISTGYSSNTSKYQ